MLKKCFAILCAIVLLVSTGTYAYAASNQDLQDPNGQIKIQLISGTLRVTASALNLRSGPGTNYSVICTLSKGTMLTILDFTPIPVTPKTWDTTWFKVHVDDGTYAGKEGWVYGQYVEGVDLP
ncbi:MAG: SH3 domain-containing protein [Clostridiaceae bacterium]|jgi:uncharacterized protein YgiM (DUF1202 family)|nr:SH3 domain-containing protein [Clostridiaceae bacterium]